MFLKQERPEMDAFERKKKKKREIKLLKIPRPLRIQVF